MGNAVKWYLTGASADGIAQPRAALSLGAFRAYDEVQSVYARRLSPIQGLVIEGVAGQNAGIGQLRAAGANSLVWRGGPETQVLPGGRAVLAGIGAERDSWISVFRQWDSVSLGGIENIQFVTYFNNVIGGSDYADGETAPRVRCVEFVYDLGVTDLWLWLEDGGAELGMQALPLSNLRTAGEEGTPAEVSFSAPTYEFPLRLSDQPPSVSRARGLWIRRSRGAASPDSGIIIRYAYIVDGMTYTGAHPGRWRVADASLARYALWIGQDAAPDTSGAPSVTGTALPLSGGVLDPAHTYYVRRGRRNAWGIEAIDPATYTYVLDAEGAIGKLPPLGPSVAQVTPWGDGHAHVDAIYDPRLEPAGNASSAWGIWVTGDDTVPDPDGVPTAVVAMGTSPGPRVLSWTGTAQYVDGAPLRAIVRTRRNDAIPTEPPAPPPAPVYVWSTNTAEATPGACSWWGPERPAGAAVVSKNRAAWSDRAAFVEETVYVDEVLNIRFVLREGATELWWDTQLVWTIRLDDVTGDVPGIYTTFAVNNGDVSGAGTGEPLEIMTDGGAKQIYICVRDVRRMLIDCAAGTITINAAEQSETMIGSLAQYPVWPRWTDAVFQVVSAETGEYTTGLAVGIDGVTRHVLGWKQKETQEECL